MRNPIMERQERGIALLLVLFTMLLLSVIGLGMMYSTNMESAINSNYRDKQTALYAALAGLQESRDRIQPATANIVAPTGLPAFVSSGSATVIYIVADSTVDPTDPNNAFFDPEFCQEKVLGMTGTAGVPCTSAPSPPTGTSWYQPLVNHSLSASAPWNLSAPLDLKWIRINLKGNNMTPVATNGDSATSTQVCWDGQNQVLLPGGYTSSCAPNGSVTTITPTNPGSGYTSQPAVTISAPPAGGTQATATASLTSVSTGQVASVTLTTGGTGYTSAPTVTLSGGGGSGATATATIVAPGSPVQAINVTSSGTRCYSTPPSVSISGGGGTGATATATLAASSSCVYSWNPTASCGSPWKSNTETGITLSGGGGSSFSGTITFHSSGHSITSSSIQNSGTGYTSAPTTAGGGSPDALTSSCVVTPNAVVGKLLSSVTVTNGGSGYTSFPTITFGTGNGVGTLPTGTATLGPAASNAGQVTSVTVTSPGSGYTSPPTVQFTGGGGSLADAVSALGVTTTVTSFTINNAGSGYTADPTVTIAPPGTGTQATATATIGRGTNYGKVWMLTALAQTKTGARAMAQLEVASPVIGYASDGGFGLLGPNPTIGQMPNSNNFTANGNDANSCGGTAQPPHPAITGYDDPNASPPTNSVQTITNSLPRPDHYIGAGGTPSVQNGYSSLGETMTTPTGLKSLIDSIHAVASTNGTLYGNNPGSIAHGDATHPVVDYVDGDLTGSDGGYGILVVTGTLSWSGNFSWHGMVLVIGDGIANFSGGGGGTITGTMLVAKIWDSHTTKNLLNSLGSPTFSWNGGGSANFGLSYDHCWSDDLMKSIPFTPAPSTKPLRILSLRLLPY